MELLEKQVESGNCIDATALTAEAINHEGGFAELLDNCAWHNPA